MKKLLLLVLFGTTNLLTYGQTQMDLPVSFDDPTVNYGVAGFEGAEDSFITTDPTNPSNTVVQLNKPATAGSSAGVTVTAFDMNNFATGFATAIPITAENTKMSVRTRSPDAGIPVMLKIEDKNDPTRSVETITLSTVAGA